MVYLSQSGIYVEGCISHKFTTLTAEPLTSTHLGVNLVYYILWLNIVSTPFQSIIRTKINAIL